MDERLSLNETPLFEGIDERDMDALSGIVSYRKYEAGETIFKENDEGFTLYIILKGSVRLFREVRDGEEQNLAIIKPGKFMGELSLFEKGGHTATASALRETELATINGVDFEGLCESNPRLGSLLLHRIALTVCTLLRDMDQKLIDMIKYVWEFGAKT